MAANSVIDDSGHLIGSQVTRHVSLRWTGDAGVAELHFGQYDGVTRGCADLVGVPANLGYPLSRQGAKAQSIVRQIPSRLSAFARAHPNRNFLVEIGPANRR